MVMWLFHECRLTHSCRGNRRPSRANAASKTAGGRKGGTVRPLIVVTKFSGEPCLSMAFRCEAVARVSGTSGERKQLTGGGSIRCIGYARRRKIVIGGFFL